MDQRTSLRVVNAAVFYLVQIEDAGGVRVHVDDRETLEPTTWETKALAPSAEAMTPAGSRSEKDREDALELCRCRAS